MQTISVPYDCSDEGREFIRECRRLFSSAVRSAYTNAIKYPKQKELRDFVKSRFAGGFVDAWVLHCATLEAQDLRKVNPDGKLIFGSGKEFARRVKGLISNEEWKEKRLRPLCSRGDKTFLGNRHFRLSADARTCTFQMYGKKVELALPEMLGNSGQILREAAQLAASKKINLTFRIDSSKLHITIDPQDLPNHPERRLPVTIVKGRALGIDLNPENIGLSVVENLRDPTLLSRTALLDHQLIELSKGGSLPAMLVRETLAAVCDRAIRLCRKWGVGLITFEKGLGKLRSGGRSLDRNRTLNFWARSLLVNMMRRKAALAGISVVEVWAGYSSTIGNLAFEAPDACASAAEIGRRGLALSAKKKDVLPEFEEGWLSGRRKDLTLPVEAGSWKNVHQAIKSAKLGYRRPHPTVSDPDTPVGAYAVHRLKHRHRPGLLYLTRGRVSGDADNRSPVGVNSLRLCHSTRKSE